VKQVGFKQSGKSKEEEVMYEGIGAWETGKLVPQRGWFQRHEA